MGGLNLGEAALALTSSEDPRMLVASGTSPCGSFSKPTPVGCQLLPGMKLGGAPHWSNRIPQPETAAGYVKKV